VLGVLGIFGLVSCTGGTSSPSGTVKAFMEAGKAGDKSGFMKCVESKDRKFFEKMEAKQPGRMMDPMGARKDLQYSVGEEKISGDTATVKVTVKDSGNEKTEELKLVKEDGQWKIDLIPDDMMKMVEGMEGAMKTIGADAKKQMEEALEEVEQPEEKDQ